MKRTILSLCCLALFSTGLVLVGCKKPAEEPKTPETPAVETPAEEGTETPAEGTEAPVEEGTEAPSTTAG